MSVQSKNGCGCASCCGLLTKMTLPPCDCPKCRECSGSFPHTGKSGFRFVSGAEFARLLNEAYYRRRRTPPMADPKFAAELTERYHPKERLSGGTMETVAVPVSTEGLPPVAPVSQPRPFKVGDSVRIGDGHASPSARGKIIRISDIDPDGWLHGELHGHGRIGVDPKNATLVDDVPPWTTGLTDGDPSIEIDIFPMSASEGLRGLAMVYGDDAVAFEGEDTVSVTVPKGKFKFRFPGIVPDEDGEQVSTPNSGRTTPIEFKYDPDNQSEFTEHATPVDWPSQPRSGRTTRMLLRAVHDALEGKSSRVVVSGSLDVCKMLRNRSEAIVAAIPRMNSTHTMGKHTTSTAFVLKFDGLSKRVHKAGEPKFIVPPAVIEFVPEPIAAGLESPPADWNHWNDNGEDRS